MEYICYLKSIVRPERRLAEIALFRKNFKEAENILLNAGMIYRCIIVQIDLFQWDRFGDLELQVLASGELILRLRHHHRYSHACV